MGTVVCRCLLVFIAVDAYVTTLANRACHSSRVAAHDAQLCLLQCLMVLLLLYKLLLRYSLLLL